MRKKRKAPMMRCFQAEKGKRDLLIFKGSSQDQKVSWKIRDRYYIQINENRRT